MIELPLPKFIVFYNGMREEPERVNLYLHDAFPPKYGAEDADLDCRAILININAGHNKKIMKKCRRLEEYALFVEKIREYQRKKYSIEEAIDRAVDDCVYYKTRIEEKPAGVITLALFLHGKFL